MISGYPIWVVLIIGVGVFSAGFVDSIGGGGGIISVPIYLLSGLPTHFALGTNKMSSCIGTAVSTARYLKKGYVNWGLAIPSALLAMAGAFFGTKIQLAVDERILKYVLVVVLPVSALILLRQKSLPETEGEMAVGKRRAIVWISTFLIGVYDGFYGPGTGTFLLLAYCTLAKLDVRTASGNVKVANFSSNLAALTTSLLAGKVLIWIGLIAACFSIAGHYVGSGLAIKNGSKIVRPVILVVLSLLLIRVILELFGVL